MRKGVIQCNLKVTGVSEVKSSAMNRTNTEGLPNKEKTQGIEEILSLLIDSHPICKGKRRLQNDGI